MSMLEVVRVISHQNILTYISADDDGISQTEALQFRRPPAFDLQNLQSGLVGLNALASL